MTFGLSTDRPDRRTFAALHYAAMTQSSDQLYGSLPDEIWLYESTSSSAPRLHHVCDNLGITIRSITMEQNPIGAAERFLETLKLLVWETVPIYMGTKGTIQSNKTEYLTLHELEDMLRDCIINYHQQVNSETGQSPLSFWRTQRFPCPADPHLLASLLGRGIHRTITHRGIYYQNRWYWHDELTALSPETEVLVYPTPSLARPKTIEVFHQGRWICTALISRF